MFKRKTTFFSKKLEEKQNQPLELEKRAVVCENAVAKEMKEPIVLHIYVRSFDEEVRILSNISSIKDRIKACQLMGHLIYYGGPVLEAHIRKETHGIDLLLDILKKGDENNSILWMQSLQTITIICRCSKLVQETICNKGAFDILTKLMMTSEGEIRQWAIHGILALMCKRKTLYSMYEISFELEYQKYKAQLTSKEFTRALKKSVEYDDWSLYDNNDANELESLISLFAKI